MSWNIDVPDTQFFIDHTQGNRYKQEFQYLVKDTQSDEFQCFVNEINAQKFISIDTETTGLVTWKDIPLYWSVAWGNRRVTLRSETLDYFRHLFADPTITWIFANAKYDMHILANYGLQFSGHCVDTQVMHSLLYEDHKHALKLMAGHLLGWTWADFETSFGKIDSVLGEERAILLREACMHMGAAPHPIDSRAKATAWDIIRIAEWHNLPLLVEYAANDAWGTWLLYWKLKEQLESSGTFSLYPQYISNMWEYFERVEKPYTKVLWKMERRGVLIDQQRLQRAAPEAKAAISRIERDITRHAGRMINPNSPKQLREYFIDQEGLKPLKMSKGGKSGVRSPSVDSYFLEHYQNDHPVAHLIQEYRKYTKLYGTYIEGMSGLLDPNGRIHTTYSQSNVRTGRLSSSQPNLQNIPRPENDYWELRSGFITTPGWKIVAADYSQLEMRLLACAALAQDMIDVFLRSWDIHCGNAALMYDLPYEDIFAGNELKKKLDTPELELIKLAEELAPGIMNRGDGDIKAYLKYCAQCRADAKNIGFGMNYGMGARKLANDLGCSEQEARAKIRTYKDTYPAVERFMESAIEEGRQYGYSFTVLGRRRNIPMIASSRKDEQALGERLAVNTQIQGSAADVCKMAQNNLDGFNMEVQYNAHALLQIHDELVFEVPEEYAPNVKSALEEIMPHPFWAPDLRVPLEVDAAIGNNWNEAK